MGESSLDRIANVSRGRGVGPSLAPRMHARLARRDTTSAVGGYCTRMVSTEPLRDPSERWCGRGGHPVPPSPDEARPGTCVTGGRTGR